MTDRERFLKLMKDFNISVENVDLAKEDEGEIMYSVDDIKYVLAVFVFNKNGEFVRIISEP